MAFWATGQGTVTPGGVDGETITNAKTVITPVKVGIGSLTVDPLWTGLIYTGEMQVNVAIPANAPTGKVPLVITMGSSSSRTDATIAIK